MVYEYVNKTLNLYQDTQQTISQVIHPITGKAFMEKEEAMDWLLHHIKTSLGYLPVSAKLNFVNLNVLSKDIREFHCQEPFRVEFQIENDCSEDDITMYILKDNKVINKYNSKIQNKILAKNLILEQPGQYEIYLEGVVNTESGKKVILHEKNSFIFDLN